MGAEAVAAGRSAAGVPGKLPGEGGSSGEQGVHGSFERMARRYGRMESEPRQRRDISVNKGRTMHTTRSRFLKTMAGTASLGLADVTSLGGLGAFAEAESAPVPEKVRFGPDIEPIVRLIEETPRGQCVAALIEQLQQGLPYRRFLAGVFFAGIRRLNSNHDVYKIQPVHQVSMEVRPEERLLPLFWAVDGFKQRQEDFPNPPLTELKGPLPASEKAAAELAAAFERADLDASERALVVLARNLGARQTMEQLWPYGCRNGGGGGHAAIVVSSCFRALDTHRLATCRAGPALCLAGRLFPGRERKAGSVFSAEHGPRGSAPGEAAPGLGRRQRRSGGHPRIVRAVTGRQGRSGVRAGGRAALGGVGAQAIWDAVHLATAELMVRHSSGWGVASRPLHSNTSAAALHYAFRTSDSVRTRLLALLQAVAWTGDKTNSELSDESLRDIAITELPPPLLRCRPLATRPWPRSSPCSLPGTITGTPKPEAVTTYGNRADADEACRKVFVLAKERPEAVPLFVQAAQSWMCQKATGDAHDYKFLAAIFEEAQWVSPQWQPHLLAASVHFLHGKQSLDHPVVQQAREALRKMG